MSEFRVHNLVAELLDAVGVDSSRPEKYVKMLTQAGSEPTVSAITAKGVISRHNPEGSNSFLQQYDDLKATASNELDPLVYVLGKVVENPDLAGMLSTASVDAVAAAAAPPTPVPAHTPASVATITDEDMAQLRSELAAATKKKPSDGGGSVGGGSASNVGGGGTGRSRRTASSAVSQLTANGNPSGNVPTMPGWAASRPMLTPDFPELERPPARAAVQIGSLSREVQELAVVDDLLSVLIGIEGKYITILPRVNLRGEGDGAGAVEDDLGAVSDASGFECDAGMDASLAELVGRVLPVCASYSAIACFTDGRLGYAQGSVRQALCAAMRALVKEYLIVVAQLETQYRRGNMSVQKLLLYVQPCMRTMTVLAEVAQDVHRGRLLGGALLSYLHEKAMGSIGDVRTQELMLHMAQAASTPYLTILEGWIYRGVIEDPFQEFMVEEEVRLDKDRVKRHYNDLYWDRRYTLCPARTPAFLAKLSDKILRTGKYLNVMRESGFPPQVPAAVDLIYQLRERAYVDTIENGFVYASRSLLDMLTTDLKLMDRLTSLKNYFCMGCGDFFAHFLDSTEDELSKLVRDIVPSRLEALLEMALRVSSASKDEFKDDLRCGLVPHNLITELFRILNVTHDHNGKERMFVNPEDMSLEGPDSMAGSTLTGLEAFTFEYEVRFPLSLIISRKSLKRYQLIFRHLLQCRHVERTLCRTWQDDQRMKDTRFGAGSWQISAFALRQRMLNFVQSFQYYMSFEVVEPNWHIMAEKLSGASTIDDVLGIHDGFLDTCLKECMLTNPSSLKTISKLLSVCTIFSNSMKRIASDSISFPQTPRGLSAASHDRKFESTVKQFDAKFSGLMDKLLDSLTDFADHAGEASDVITPPNHFVVRELENTDRAHMSNMVYRLDFNGYYSATKVARARASRAAAAATASAAGGSAPVAAGGAPVAAN